jgi:carbon storage regulator
VLVLSRRLDESIQIGPDVKVTVVSIKNGAVKLGIETPDGVQVLRTELINKIKFDLTAQRDALVKPDQKPV